MNDIPALIAYGNEVFNNLANVIDLTDIDAIKTVPPNSTLPDNFVPINQTASDFYLKVKPHNGLRALKRGFYKLIPEPELVHVLDFKVWRMDVLFNEGPSSDIIYKYGCNVGPLVNKFAVCRHLINKQFVGVPDEHGSRELFLRKLENKTIYVSSSEMVHVHYARKSYDPKEVLWFRWD